MRYMQHMKHRVILKMAVARQYKGYKNIAGPSFFTYSGRLVTGIAHETQWKDF